jgi:hypothetical protein
MKGAPQEERRLQIPRAFLERTIHDLNDYLQGCISELVFNLNEIGISDWEDRKTKKVLAAAAMFGQTMHHGLSRIVKHISMIACVSVAGKSRLPYMVTSENSSTVQEHFRKQGVRLGRDFILKFNQKPYINAGIFLDYIGTIFSPSIDVLRGLAVFSQEVAVLLIDNCWAHVSDDVIRLMTFAPHTTQVFQIFASPSLVFPSGVRGMNCPSITIMRRSNS